MNKYNEKVSKLMKGDISMKDFASTYFRSQPELSALFTQAINSLYPYDKNGSLKSIQDLYGRFKWIFHGYEHLTPKIKKMLPIIL